MGYPDMKLNLFPLLSFFKNFYFILECSYWSAVLASYVQQGDAVIHIYVSIHFKILFSFKSFQKTEQSSLCYTVGSLLSVLNIVVCIC